MISCLNSLDFLWLLACEGSLGMTKSSLGTSLFSYHSTSWHMPKIIRFSISRSGMIAKQTGTQTNLVCVCVWGGYGFATSISELLTLYNKGLHYPHLTAMLSTHPNLNSRFSTSSVLILALIVSKQIEYPCHRFPGLCPQVHCLTQYPLKPEASQSTKH